MTCSRFLARYSDYVDGLLAETEHEACARHLGECDRCSRYVAVIEKGREVLSRLPRPRPAPGFRTRLRYRLSDGRRSRLAQASGVNGTMLFVVGGIMAALAWSPVLWLDGRPTASPGADNDESVVGAPEFPTESWRSQSALPVFVRVGGDREHELRLWDDSHLLLYEHSSVARRYRAEAVFADAPPDG